MEENTAESRRLEAYQRGLRDAWDVARKIRSMSPAEEAIVFDLRGNENAISKYDVDDATQRLEAYENIIEKGDMIDPLLVGDEVSDCDVKGVVTYSDPVRRIVCVMCADGSSGEWEMADWPNRTGRRYPQVAELLRAIREG